MKIREFHTELWLPHRRLVRPDIGKILQFRGEALRARFAISKANQS